MYELEVTDAQFLLLRGLVARAADHEQIRLARMLARPRGTHRRDVFASAEALARDLGQLERAVERAWTDREDAEAAISLAEAEADGIDTAAAIESQYADYGYPASRGEHGDGIGE